VGGYHNKSIIVDAPYPIDGVTRRRQLVWTGSHNLYSGSLHSSDEDMVRIEDYRVHRAYRDNFLRLWREAEDFI
jgi:phosphatidylserine/phosphatidylglycerophosphate/cardiolipin synthase-like enzyme